MYEVFIAYLGVYAVVTIVTNYHGPFNALYKLRQRYGLFNCEVCLSPYVSLLPAFGMGMSIWEYFAIVGLVVLTVRLYESVF